MTARRTAPVALRLDHLDQARRGRPDRRGDRPGRRPAADLVDGPPHHRRAGRSSRSSWRPRARPRPTSWPPFRRLPVVSTVRVTRALDRVFGKRVIVIGGGAQVAQVALGAVSEADRHNLRGERISVDTIPLVGEQQIAEAVRAVADLPRARLLVLAGSLMGGEISRAVRRAPAAGHPGDRPEHGRLDRRARRPGGVRPGPGRHDGGHGDRRHCLVRPRPPARPPLLGRHYWAGNTRALPMTRTQTG